MRFSGLPAKPRNSINFTASPPHLPVGHDPAVPEKAREKTPQEARAEKGTSGSGPEPARESRSLPEPYPASNHLAQALQPIYSDIGERVKTAAVLYADETGWRISGITHWRWGFVTDTWGVTL